MSSFSERIKKRTEQLLVMIEESKCRLEHAIASTTLGTSGENTSEVTRAEVLDRCNLPKNPVPLMVEGIQDLSTLSKVDTNIEEEEGITFALGKNVNLGCTQRARGIDCEGKNNVVAEIAQTYPIFSNKLLDKIQSKGVAIPIAELYTHTSPMENGNSSKEDTKIDRGSYAKVVGNVNKDLAISARSEMNLNYFPFQHEPGTPRIRLEPDEQAMMSWKNCLVGYFLCEKIPYFVVREEVFRIWGKRGLKRMSCTNTGFYFFDFESDESRNEVLENGLCYIFGKLLVLKKWHVMLSLTKEDMGKIPIWIRLFNLPYEFWSSENLSKIASIFGRPLYADRATEKLLRFSYARICVEIDAFKELYKSIEVEYAGQVVTVEVDYQGVPPSCKMCKVFGHDKESCPTNPSPQVVKVNNNMYQAGYKGRQVAKGSYLQKFQWQVVGKNAQNNSSKVHDMGVDSVNNGQSMRKLVDRNGKIASVKEVKKLSSLNRDRPFLKSGNSFDIIADLEDDERLPNVNNKKGKNVGVAAECSSEVKGKKNHKLDMKDIKNVTGKRAYAAAVTGVNCNPDVQVCNVWNSDPSRDLITKVTDEHSMRIESKLDANVDNKSMEGNITNELGMDVKASIGDYMPMAKSIQGKNASLQCEAPQKENSKMVKIVAGMCEEGEGQPKQGMYKAIERLYSIQKTELPHIDFETKEEKKDRNVIVGDDDKMKGMIVVNPELNSALFEAFNDCDAENIIRTPVTKGLSFSDYPDSMSKKQKKKRIKTFKNAISAKKSKKDPP